MAIEHGTGCDKHWRTGHKIEKLGIDVGMNPVVCHCNWHAIKSDWILCIYRQSEIQIVFIVEGDRFVL